VKRRALVAVVALLWAAPSPAEEAKTPLLILREPDPRTAREIEDLLSARGGLQDSDYEERAKARAHLAAIGPWAVPFLCETVAGRKAARSARVRMNAVLALARIRDPRCLPALRSAAQEDDDLWVRRAATLALGVFENPADLETLRGMLQARNPKLQHTRAAAPALARLRVPAGGALLEGACQQLPRDRYDAAALVLAASVSAPAFDPLPLVDARQDKLVQAAAAAGLLVRPLSARRAGELLDLLKKPGLDGGARTVLIHALGAIPSPGDEVRARLLDLARGKGTEADREQIAALIALDPRPADFADLKTAFRRFQGRNDPVAAAFLDALARTGAPESVDYLLGLARTGSEFVKFYAWGSLAHHAVTGAGPEAGRAILAQIPRGQAHRDVYLKQLDALLGLLAYKPELAAGEFAKLAEPRELHLWDWTREDRAWRIANHVLALIFELDKLDPGFDSSGVGRSTESAVGGGGGGEAGRKAASSPDELDLAEFFSEQPYFGPEDLQR